MLLILLILVQFAAHAPKAKQNKARKSEAKRDKQNKQARLATSRKITSKRANTNTKTIKRIQSNPIGLGFELERRRDAENTQQMRPQQAGPIRPILPKKERAKRSKWKSEKLWLSYAISMEPTWIEHDTTEQEKCRKGLES